MEPTSTAPEVETHVEEIGPCRKKIQVKIPGETVHGEFEKNYRNLGTSVSLPGFRKGRVPRSIIERKYGSDVAQDVKHRLIEQSFQHTIRKYKLAPVGRPEIDLEKVVIKSGQPLEYELTLEVQPTFELGKYKGHEAAKPKLPVTDADVEAALQSLARDRAVLVPVEEGGAGPEDIVLCDITVTRDGEIVGQREGATLSVAEERIAGWKAPGLTAKLTGIQAGQVVDVDLPLPRADETRKQEIGCATIKVREVKRIEVPTPDEDWAKELDFDSLGELQGQLRKQLEAQREQEALRSVDEALLDRILEEHPFEVPESLAKKQVDATANRLRMQLQMDGKPPNEIESLVADYSERNLEDVVRALKKGFLLDKIAEAEKIFVTDDDMNNQIEAMARRYRHSPDQILAQLQNNDQIDDLRSEIRERKARAALRAVSKITDAS